MRTDWTEEGKAFRNRREGERRRKKGRVWKGKKRKLVFDLKHILVCVCVHVCTFSELPLSSPLSQADMLSVPKGGSSWWKPPEFFFSSLLETLLEKHNRGV